MPTNKKLVLTKKKKVFLSTSNGALESNETYLINQKFTEWSGKLSEAEDLIYFLNLFNKLYVLAPGSYPHTLEAKCVTESRSCYLVSFSGHKCTNFRKKVI